ncbi:MAG: hypothetical protein FJZ12_00815 [Candidatus Omnitrophica bacterium]|nr:hypothetical protein [Candidatus Omnitrophota bacterium]
MDKRDTKNLKKRYLIWFYKNLKEELDRTERKFTQVQLDTFILKEFKSSKNKDKVDREFIKQFESYVNKKKKDGAILKFDGKALKSEYVFLVAKLKAVEKAIIKEFGKKGLEEIKRLYEKEMTERILRSREH